MDPPKPVLVAPDAFKGTFAARPVSEAIGRGLRGRGIAADLCPLADGGEGSAAAIAEALGGELGRHVVSDPLGRPIDAELTLLADRATAMVEVAAASGLSRLEPDEYDAEAASSGGTGELIAAAIGAGARHVIVAAGGSASTDGGAGALDAIAAAGGLRGARLSVLCDVRTPWERAANVFGPQKGADATTVERLECRLDALAERLPRDPRGMPMGGCAGGLSGGLWAALDAELVPGADWTMRAVGFDRRLRRARAVIVGEGRLDEQSFEGKVCGEVLSRAGRLGIEVFALVGRCALSEERCVGAGFAAVSEAGSLEAISAAAARLPL